MTKTQARILLVIIGYTLFCWLVPIIRPCDLPYLESVVSSHIVLAILGVCAAGYLGINKLLFIAFPDEPEKP